MYPRVHLPYKLRIPLISRHSQSLQRVRIQTSEPDDGKWLKILETLQLLKAGSSARVEAQTLRTNVDVTICLDPVTADADQPGQPFERIKDYEADSLDYHAKVSEWIKNLQDRL